MHQHALLKRSLSQMNRHPVINLMNARQVSHRQGYPVPLGEPVVYPGPPPAQVPDTAAKFPGNQNVCQPSLPMEWVINTKEFSRH